MKPSDDELDRLIDSLLGETLGTETAPDLRAKILARIPERKVPASRRFRRLDAAGNSWVAAAVAAIVFVGLILTAILLSGNPDAPVAHHKPVEKVPTAPEIVPPPTPDPVPAPLPPQRREPDPSPKPLETPRPIPPAPKEEPKKVEPDPAPTPVPAPPKENRETRVTGIARLTLVEGDVQLVDGDNRAPAAVGQDLLPRHGLTSGPRSRAVLKYPDGTTVELGPETVIRDLAEGSGRGKTFFLARGSVAAAVAKQLQDRPMILTTPHGEAKVLGTTLKLKVDEKGATRLDVVEGKVKLTRLTDSKGVEVVSGHYAVTAAGVEFVSRPIAAPRTGTPDRPAIVKVQMMDAETGQPLLQLDPIEDRMTISLAELPTKILNIRAITSPEKPGCVVFNLDGEFKVEANAPFLLMGNNAVGKPLPWTPSAGDHVLTVTAYSGGPAPNRREGLGAAGAPLTVRFRIK